MFRVMIKDEGAFSSLIGADCRMDMDAGSNRQLMISGS